MPLMRCIDLEMNKEMKRDKTYKAHMIMEVVKDSIAEYMGIVKGDQLLAINETPIQDVLDYRYLLEDDEIEIYIKKANGEEIIMEIEKYTEEDLGLVFETDLMDDLMSCKNKCQFCFIDQLPPHMRETVYFKDDDWRMSFLHGNYITLTNMSENDMERLMKYHLSPMNISIHVTDPSARIALLNNRFAGNILNQIKRLVDAGIEINGQIVLCKGLNDGDLLDQTIKDLSQFIPSILSLTIVPVGLSEHREGLAPLEVFEKEDAKKVIKTVHKWQEYYLEKMGTRFVFLADEFYVTANHSIPPYEAYEDFPVLENGVGMLALFQEEFEQALKNIPLIKEKRVISIATGVLAEDFIKKQADKLKQKAPNIKILVYPIENKFFGKFVTVTGLLTGVDIIKQLKNKELGDTLLLSNTMLKDNEIILLDDVTITDISERLKIPVTIVENNGARFIQSILQIKE